MNELDVYIDGFGIAGYKSFGPDLQLIGPLRKLNLLIGPNNSGKSNILLFLVHQFAVVLDTARSGHALPSFQGLDRHLGSGEGSTLFSIALALGGSGYDTWAKSLEARLAKKSVPFSYIDRILKSDALEANGTDIAWFHYDTASGGKPAANQAARLLKSQVLQPYEWERLWSALTDQNGGSIEEHWIPQTLQRLSPVNRGIPSVTLIPAIRQVMAETDQDGDFSGRGLIERLAQLQKPDWNAQALKKQFEAINAFIKFVLSNESAELEIPVKKDTITLHLDGRPFPLAAVGAGVHEVIILAAAATILQNQIVCIEEPELHLHPLLQRKLVTYLTTQTSNQYFIATHSAHLLDVPDAAIFQVKHREGQTRVRQAVSSREKFQVCVDLGYRASDLLQANCVIWVEGPSDRVYLKEWISHTAPELLEGTHYSIMFYGGRLLSHLSADDLEVTEFISLRRLNRHIAIVMDSDRSSDTDDINETKQRVRSELAAGQGFCWITAGREIENYLPSDTIERALRAVHRDFQEGNGGGKYTRCLRYNGETKDADKVKVAHTVTQEPPDLSILDLREKLAELVVFIKEANGLPK